MASNAVGDSMTTTNTKIIVDDLVLNIDEMVKEIEALPNCDAGVCVYRVPRSLSSSKPEAFIPHFIGLGPYHHLRPDVVTRQQMKVAAATTVLKLMKGIQLKELVEKMRNLNHLATFIRYCYDGNIELNDFGLLYLMTLDALFLYYLLCSLDITQEATSHDECVAPIVTKFTLSISILSGKHGIPEDDIIRDLFLLENQVPTLMLTHVITLVLTATNHTQEPHLDVDEHVGSEMLKFCRALCPFLNIEQLPTESQAVKRLHLLDLMYNLIVPEPEPEPEPEIQLQTQPKPRSEAKDNQQEQGDNNGKSKKLCTCCLNCCLVSILCCFVIYILVNIIRWVLTKIVDLIVQLIILCYPAVVRLHSFLESSGLSTWAKPVGAIKDAIRILLPKESDINDGRLAVTIPSATKLSEASIKFKPAKGNISSIEFDEKNNIFYLPMIKLNVNSETMIRNLVAYELMTKSQGLLFTRYVELMRCIIATAEDVKVLQGNDDDKGKIIQTQLSDEEVAKVFNEMSQSIRPTSTSKSKLDKEIKKVNDKYDGKHKPPTVDLCLGIISVLVVLAFVVLAAKQAYCSIFSCSRTLKFDNLRQGGEYDRNSYFISSI